MSLCHHVIVLQSKVTKSLFLTSHLIGWKFSHFFEEIPKGERNEDRIVNGAEAETQPWLASLIELDEEARTWTPTCGGSLINKRFVL